MAVLVSGATGFVGTHLARRLAARGLECWGLDLAGTPEREGYSRRFAWEYLDEIPWGGVDAVVHLAGMAHDLSQAPDEVAYRAVNLGLSRRLWDAAHLGWCATGGAEGKRFVYFSSVKVYGNAPGAAIRTEATPPAPQTPYGRTKLEAEKYLRAAAKKDRGAGLYILRPALICGPKAKGNLALLSAFARWGLPWPFGAFENRRSFCGIGNICAVVEKICRGGVAPGTYQVADDETVSTVQLVKMLGAAAGRWVWVWRIPKKWIELLAMPGEVWPRWPLDRERLGKMTGSEVVSNAKIKAACGWKEMPFRLEEGVREAVAAGKSGD